MTNQLLKEQPSLLKKIATHEITWLILGLTIGGYFLYKQGIIQKLTGKLFSKKTDSEE